MSECAKMIRAECANWRNGECLFTEDGVCPVMAGHRCSVSRNILLGGKPCAGTTDYFSAAVLPLASTHKPEYAPALAEYAAICGSKAAKVKRCACGEPRAHGKQCCDLCREKRAKERKREWAASRRKLKNSPSQVVTQ